MKIENTRGKHMFGTIMPEIQVNPAIVLTVWAIVGVATLLVHFVFAAYVFRDCCQLRRVGVKPFGPGPIIWFLATLIGGVFVATAYWLMSHSSLNRHHT